MSEIVTREQLDALSGQVAEAVKQDRARITDLEASSVSDSIGSIDAGPIPPEAPPSDGKFHLWFNTSGVEA